MYTSVNICKSIITAQPYKIETKQLDCVNFYAYRQMSFVTAFWKTVPNRTITEIHSIA